MMPLVGNIDPSFFGFVVSGILGGGLVTAIINYRKAGPEMESVAVTTLRGVLEELRDELERKDRQIAEQNKTIGKLAQQVNALKDQILELEMRLDDPPAEYA